MSDARVHVRLCEGALRGGEDIPLFVADSSETGVAPGSDVPGVVPGVGAVVVFEGVVRAGEGDGVIEALDYEVYEPMTGREMRRLARDVCDAFGLMAIAVEHSVGRVAVGRVSFRLRVAAAHRREALDATDAFIARMKRDVPLWKTPLWVAGSGCGSAA